VISDTNLVETIAALYAPDGRFQRVETTAGITWGLSRNYGAQLLVFRGSVTAEDWLRDLESEASRVVAGYPSLGPVPYGFGEGLLDAYKAVNAALAPNVSLYVLGHSLGAARAAAIAGMLVLNNKLVERLVLCGCPKPGMIALKTLLSPVPCVNYRNGRDPVPDLPVPLPPLLEWRAVAPLTLLNVPPPDPSDAMAWHHIALYVKGVTQGGTSP
jgi:pimeloyl-ACP methyl ester carboxylesterase